MKLRKIYLLYPLTTIPAFVMIGFTLSLARDISILHQLRAVDPESARIFGESTNLLFRQVFVIYLQYLTLLLFTSAAFLAIRFFRTTKGWVSISIHTILSIFLGAFLFSISFAVAALIGSFFGWNLFS